MIMMSKRHVPLARVLTAAIVTVGALSSAALAQYTSGSTGVHGPFPPIPDGMTEVPSATTDILVNMTSGIVHYCSAYDPAGRPDTCATELASVQLPGIVGELKTGIFEFSEVFLGMPAETAVSIWFVGNGYNRPVTILSQGDILMVNNAQLELHGEDGQEPPLGLGGLAGARGGEPGPGGYRGGRGGDGGAIPEPGAPGGGPAGGVGGTPSLDQADAVVGASATLLQNPRAVPLVGGSGGGGAAGLEPDADPGCHFFVGTSGVGGTGGGGGGGALLMAAENTIDFGAGFQNQIDVRGGSGDFLNRCDSGNGAPGSVRLVARTLRGRVRIQAHGGGQVVLETYTNQFTGDASGTTNVVVLGAPSLPIPVDFPTLSITSINGIAVEPDPTANPATPDVILPTAPTGSVQVGLAASGIPLGTTIDVRTVPLSGAGTYVVSTPLAGSDASSTASAQVELPPGAGTLTASTSFTLTGPTMAALGLREAPSINGQAADRVVLTASDRGTEIHLATPRGDRVSLESLRR